MMSSPPLASRNADHTVHSQYRRRAHYETTHGRRQNLYALPSAQRQLLDSAPISLLDVLGEVDDAIDLNGDLADDILRLGLASFGLSEKPAKGSALDWQGCAKPDDMSKAHSTVRQFYRDWSSEGFTREVQPLLDTVLSDLASSLPPVTIDANVGDEKPPPPPPSLLLPGAGLGRLLFELCLRGYDTTGNEISYHQLLASNFVLNGTQRPDQYNIYPFASAFTNVRSRAQQLRRYTIPDVHPGMALSSSQLETGHRVGEMNMTAGDFVLSYSQADSQDAFDGVVTVFFVDTAPNLIRYMETVRNCLREGGVWINIGPLQWHFDNRHYQQDDDHDGQEKQPRQDMPSQDRGIAEPGSFELTDQEVLHLVSKMGFDLLKHEVLGDDDSGSAAYGFGLGYIQDGASLLQRRYRCSHWVARKVSRPGEYKA